MKRCQILFELDEGQASGLTHAQIAHSYAVCLSTITNIAQSYVKNGIKNIVRYKISPNSSAALQKVDGCAKLNVPVVCMDEKPYQLLGAVRRPPPMRPRDTQKVDSEYTHNSTCTISIIIQPNLMAIFHLIIDRIRYHYLPKYKTDRH